MAETVESKVARQRLMLARESNMVEQVGMLFVGRLEVALVILIINRGSIYLTADTGGRCCVLVADQTNYPISNKVIWTGGRCARRTRLQSASRVYGLSQQLFL